MNEQSDKEALASQLHGYHGVPSDEKLSAMSNIVLDSLLASSKNNSVKSAAVEREIERRKKPWYEKPVGLVIISSVSGLLVACVIFYLRWN